MKQHTTNLFIALMVLTIFVLGTYTEDYLKIGTALLTFISIQLIDMKGGRNE